jgi:shikimate dehydrogenase
MPRLAGLIGFPVEHSISPVFQQAAFDALGIDARYERWSTPPDGLDARLRLLRDSAYLGANVTVPHKERVVDMLDEVEPIALRAGAVNTIVRSDGSLLGTNSDVEGFMRALRERGGVDPNGARVVVLGAGGAARAVVLGLAEAGAAQIRVANRHPERAARLVHDLPDLATVRLESLPWAEAVGPAELRSVDLLVHCTTLGLAGSAEAFVSPVADGALHPEIFVCDVVANPLLTPLLRQARAVGAPGLGGLPMLVYQGAAAFERWTGRAAPVDVMMDAAERAMRAAATEGK